MPASHAVMTVGDKNRPGRGLNFPPPLRQLMQGNKMTIRQGSQTMLDRLPDIDQID
jgi:hypothetical protein